AITATREARANSSRSSSSHDGAPSNARARLVVRRRAALRRHAWFAPRPRLTIPRPELRIRGSRANGLVAKGPVGMRFRVFETGPRRVFGLLLGSALVVWLLVTMPVNRGAIADDRGSETPGTVA